MITEREALLAAGFRDLGNGRMAHPRLHGRAMRDAAARARMVASQSGSTPKQENRQ